MTIELADLDAVAVAMAVVDATGRVVAVNRAFTAAGGCSAEAVVGRPFADLVDATRGDGAGGLRALTLALKHGDALDGVPIALRHADGSAWPLRLSLRHAGTQACLTLVDRRAELRAVHLDELLGLAQEFGRLGVWERDVRSLQGHWDEHMRRFWGLGPGDATPDFDRATTHIAPEDRAAMQHYAFESMRRPGRYSWHFSVIGADGVRRRLHSQWEVKPGADGRPERMVGVAMNDTDVLQMAQAVDEARAQLALAVEVSGLAIWHHDLDKDRLTFDDQGWRMLGRAPRPEGLSLAELRALIHPDDLPMVRATLERALDSGGPIDMQARYRHPDGRWVDLLTRRVVQRDAAGRPVAFTGVAMDLTERMDEHRRLLDLTRSLELAASATGVAIWSFDVATSSVHWNDQMYVLHGLDRSQTPPQLGAYLERFVPEAFHAQMRRSLARLSASAENRLGGANYRIVRTDGSTRDVAARVRSLHGETGLRLMGTLIDITEQLAERQALRDAHARVALAARAVGFGIWERETDSEVATWDEQMWRLRGLEPRGSASSFAAHLALVHPDDRPALEIEYAAARAAHRPWSVEFRVRWPDGSWHWLASRSTPIFDAAGREVRRLGVNWDITDARNAEATRQERLAAQRDSQAKSAFLSRMSHELRTPLHAVLGFAQLLQADTTLPWHAEARERVQHIRAAGQHLLALVDDVLDLSRLDAGEIRLEARNVRLRDTVDAVLPMVAAQAAAAGVTIVRGHTDVTLHVDATRLRQILLNLLTNAVKYNRRGGQVALDARADGAEVVLTVSDTGRGISAQQIAHVFEPFNRLGMEREGIEGTGIGLAIVKINVERMGGSVQLSSELGQGSRFEVRLPGAAAAQAVAEPPAAPAQPPAAPVARQAQARVLYIEDNPVNALIVRELIAQRRDLHLDEARDGLSGIEQARGAPPNLILLDMQLPDIDGMEVLRRLRADAATASIPCIALSANAMPEDIQAALGAGFADYWTKPLDFRVFMSALDSLFGKAA
ncbi:MAG: PAS domain-containing protein [Burkholderiaceae bacterium]